MTLDEIRGLEALATQLRRKGVGLVADAIDIEIQAQLDGRELEDEFERDLGVHHGRLRAEHGDPFGGAR